MVALVAVLVLGQAADDEQRLRESWPKLVEAWKAMEAWNGGKSADLSEGFVRTLGTVHAAFEAAGFYAEEPGYEVAALKRFFLSRYKVTVEKVVRPPTPKGEGEDMIVDGTLWLGDCNPQPPSYGFDTLFASLEKLRELREKGRDDEDNVAEETAIVRKSLKAFRLMSDETPSWLRRRFIALVHAMVLHEPFPEPAKATPARAGEIRDRIAELSHPDIEVREKATQALLKDGEIARPLLRESLQNSDPEVVSRVKSILGVGHAPWK